MTKMTGQDGAGEACVAECGSKYAKVVVSISHKDVDRAFDYLVPEELRGSLAIGMSVSVPFGKGAGRREGFVVGFCAEPDCDPAKVKPILAVSGEKPFFTPSMLELARWMQNKYFATLIDCLKCIVPAGMSFKSDMVVTLLETSGGEALKNEKEVTSAPQKRLLALLAECGGRALLSELENELGAGAGRAVMAMARRGLLRTDDLSAFKDLTLKVKFAFLNTENDALEDMLEERLQALREKGSPQARVLELLTECDGMAVSDIRKYLRVSNSPIESLARDGLVKIETVPVVRSAIDYEAAAPLPKPALTGGQQAALQFFQEKKDDLPVLIHGVTGSGKTEVYMRLIERALAKGKSAIMLVPEISLTPQTVSVFLNRFGRHVSVTHSRLTLGERYDQWKKARDGRISIMIGPRSALFAPFDNLGVIIIDEEHEKTYKSETSPKYSAKEVAIQRGRLSGALVVLGSATPSVESYYETRTGRMSLVRMPQRINLAMPEITLVDMRAELAEGNMSIFSGPLFAAIEENLAKGGQTILFLNRRGHSTFVSCRKCGFVMKCDACNVNFTYHAHSGRLLCHYCGKSAKSPENCPQCGSTYIKYFGVGTQKVESEVRRLFPGAGVLRMDADTTTGKHTHERILNQFRQGRAQILIGTQMIAKGLDFPGVTLVGVMAADLSLYNGDFRSGETTYQLLTQVAGRAGRAEGRGTVFIQTYNPEHYSVAHVVDGDYERFYEHEAALRRQMVYPPYSHVFSVLLTGEDEKAIITALFKLSDIMKHFNRKGLFEMIGPAPAVISKIKKRYRWKLVIKCAEEERLKNFALYCVGKLKDMEDTAGMTFNLTMDPMTLA